VVGELGDSALYFPFFKYGIGDRYLLDIVGWITGEVATLWLTSWGEGERGGGVAESEMIRARRGAEVVP